MRTLTEFQQDTERSLVEALGSIGSQLTKYELAGEHETYIRSGVAGAPFEVFIYEDEAAIHGPSIDERFEVPDYKSSLALAQHFVNTVVELARRYRSVV